MLRRKSLFAAALILSGSFASLEAAADRELAPSHGARGLAAAARRLSSLHPQGGGLGRGALPPGWTAPALASLAEVPAIPSCCTFDPSCCFHQALIDKTEPPHLRSPIAEVDLAALPLVELEPLRAVEPNEPASDVRILDDTLGRPIDPRHFPPPDVVRVLPPGDAGSIAIGAVGGAFFSHRSGLANTGTGAVFEPKKGYVPARQPFAWHSLEREGDGTLRFRQVTGQFDRLHLRMGVARRIDTKLAPIVPGLVYGFRSSERGEQSLHVITPAGEARVQNGLAASDAFPFRLAVLPLAPGKAGSLGVELDSFTLSRWHALVATPNADTSARVLLLTTSQTAGEPHPTATLAFLTPTAPEQFFFGDVG